MSKKPDPSPDPSPVPGRCDACRYYRHVTPAAGDCRRYPPQLSGSSAQDRELFVLGLSPLAGVFPRVPAGEWCGEWLGTG